VKIFRRKVERSGNKSNGELKDFEPFALDTPKEVVVSNESWEPMIKCSLRFFIPLLFFTAIATPARPADSAETPEVAGYRVFLNALDREKVNSISSARAELEKRFASAPESAAVEAFRAFRTFHAEAVRAIDRALFWQMPKNTRKDIQTALNEIMSGSPGYINRVTAELLNSDPMEEMEFLDEASRKRLEAKYGDTIRELRKLRRNGMRFYWGEGDWYAGVDSEYLVEAAGFLKGDYSDFLRFQAREEKTRTAEDAALMISLDELRQRIIRYDNFAKTHPKLDETNSEIQHEIKHLMTWYLYGTDNSPAYERQAPSKTEMTIKPELRESYERFLAENRDSSLYPVISEAYGILKRHKFLFSKELDAYIKSAGVAFSY